MANLIEQPLPHSVEAEQGLLGSMLIDPAETCPLADALPEGAWHIPAHRDIAALLLDFWRRNRPADFITLTEALRARGQLDGVGGPAFITHLFTFTPTAANASCYVAIVREQAAKRLAALASTQGAEQAFAAASTPEELADAMEAAAKATRDMAADPGANESWEVKECAMEAIENIEKLYERRGTTMGLATGFTELDRLTGGLNAPDMIVLAARPSMGKTALAMNIAEHVGVDLKRWVGVFSLEMSKSQLMQRMICSRARVNLQSVRDGFLSERDFPSLTVAASKLAGASMLIEDAAGLSVSDLRAKARQMHKSKAAEGGLSLIVIDYLQLLKGTSRRSQENRQLEIAEVSGGVKSLAKELGVPIILAAQLNRNPEARTGGRPRLSDLRESGAIEQDADVVGLIHRAEYYAENEEAKGKVEGEAELLIAKQRNGPVGEVKLTFRKEFTRFENRAGG
jgi:replicative DNA helicase